MTITMKKSQLITLLEIKKIMNKKDEKKFRVIVTIEYSFVTQTCVVS